MNIPNPILYAAPITFILLYRSANAREIHCFSFLGRKNFRQGDCHPRKVASAKSTSLNHVSSHKTRVVFREESIDGNIRIRSWLQRNTARQEYFMIPENAIPYTLNASLDLTEAEYFHRTTTISA